MALCARYYLLRLSKRFLGRKPSCHILRVNWSGEYFVIIGNPSNSTLCCVVMQSLFDCLHFFRPSRSLSRSSLSGKQQTPWPLLGFNMIWPYTSSSNFDFVARRVLELRFSACVSGSRRFVNFRQPCQIVLRYSPPQHVYGKKKVETGTIYGFRIFCGVIYSAVYPCHAAVSQHLS